jgi:hypothetical protein
MDFYGGLLGPKLSKNERFIVDINLYNEYKNKPAPFGFNGLGEVVYLRTYAREKENNESEVWVDTVYRVVNGVFEILQHYIINKLNGEWDNKLAKELSKEMFIRIFTMKFLPPGRGLWAMGAPVITKKGFAAALNNCAFVSTNNLANDKISPFVFLMDASMLGVGVGFDTIGAGSFIINKPNKDMSYTFTITDDREGWVQSVKLLLHSYFNKDSDEVQFDYSQIRGSGIKLKIFGGQSSGPEPLITLHSNIRKILDADVGKLISVTCITDIMNMIGVCTVSGNIRRCIPKNSLVHTYDGLIKIQDIKIGDMVQTSDGYEKVNEIFIQGKQKIINIITEDGEFMCTPNHKIAVIDTNTNYKWIMAKELQLGDNLLTTRVPIVGQKTYLPKSDDIIIPDLDNDMAWFIGVFSECGYTYSDNIYISLNNYDIVSKLNKQLYKFNINFTVVFNKYRKKYIIKCISKPLSIYLNKLKRIIPDCIKTGLYDIRLAYITGVKDSHNYEELIRNKLKKYVLQFQTLCYSCGFETKLNRICTDKHKILYSLITYTEHSTNIITNKLVSKKSLYHTVPVKKIKQFNKELETFDISVNNKHEFYCNGYLMHNSAEIAFGSASCKEFLNLKSYEVNPQRMEYGWASNNSIFAELGMDYTEVCKHIITNGEPGFAWLENMKAYSRMNGEPDYRDQRVSGGNPCLEQSLESMELCCLVETFPNKHENLEDFKKTLYYAFLFAKTVTLLPLHWHQSNQIMMRNRRIGCSISGIAQFITDRGLHELKQWLEQGYNAIYDHDHSISEWLCVRQSIKMTSIKPSGTISILAGATPGIHYPESQFYIRRIRMASDSPLLARLNKAGYKIEPCAVNPKTTTIVEFPVSVGKKIRTVKDISMWEQLSLAAFMQKYYADNQVSVTITFDPVTEGHQLEYALEYFQYQLKGVSFLPRFSSGQTAYKQMPYEEISEDMYNEINSKIDRSVNLSIGCSNEVVKEETMTYCDNDKCIKI